MWYVFCVWCVRNVCDILCGVRCVMCGVWCVCVCDLYAVYGVYVICVLCECVSLCYMCDLLCVWCGV